MKICQSIQKLKGDTHIHTQTAWRTEMYLFSEEGKYGEQYLNNRAFRADHENSV